MMMIVVVVVVAKHTMSKRIGSVDDGCVAG